MHERIVGCISWLQTYNAHFLFLPTTRKDFILVVDSAIFFFWGFVLDLGVILGLNLGFAVDLIGGRAAAMMFATSASFFSTISYFDLIKN